MNLRRPRGTLALTMGFHERLDRILQIAMLVFILTAAGFLSAITTIRIAIRGRIVQEPNVVGQDSRSAQKTLAAQGLDMRIADRVYTDAPADRIVRQIPAPGEQVKVGQQTQVVLSLGSRRVAVPVLEGRSLRAARIELLRLGLQAGEISAAYLSDEDAEIVVRQDPSPGEMAASPHVNMLVSQGLREPAYLMPQLVGMTQSDAQRILALGGLRGVKLSFVPAAEGAPHGAVLQQTPSAGARVTPSLPVELRISE